MLKEKKQHPAQQYKKENMLCTQLSISRIILPYTKKTDLFKPIEFAKCRPLTVIELNSNTPRLCLEFEFPLN